MTSTHCSMNHERYINMGLEYSSVIFEESGQILDIQQFMGMSMQKDQSKLKRIIMLGDTYQLNPVIKNKIISNQARMN